MESYNLDFEKLSLKLEEILKCPICLEYLEPPVAQCMRGHGICGQCKKQLLECPMCRGEFLGYKATMLTQLVEAVPRPCKYRVIGCPVISFVRDKHINHCELRTIKCYLCGAPSPANALLKHYEKTHKKIYSVDKPSELVTEFKLTESTTRFSLFCYFGHLFWRTISVEVEKKLFTVTFICIPLGKPTGKYSANISLTKGNLKYSSVSSVPFRKDISMESAIPNIIVPLQEMSHFVNKAVETLCFDSLNIEEEK